MDRDFTSPYSHLPVAVFTCDQDGYINYYNSAAATLWGHEPQIGVHQWNGAWKIFDMAGNLMDAADSPIARVIKNGETIGSAEIIIQTPTGELKHVVGYPAPLYDEAGNVAGVLTTLIDISDKKSGEKKQAHLAAIIESSEDAIVSKTLDGIITSWNHAAEQMFEYTEKEVVGQSISIIIPGERLSEETLIIGKIRKGERIDHFETIRRTKSGKMIPLSLTVSPIKNASGEIIGASKIARNITAQKEAEAQLQRYAENLEILNEVSKAVAEHMDTQSILQKVTDATTKLTGASFGAFFYNLVDKRGESYTLFALSGAPREAFEKFGMPRNTAVFNATFTGQGIVRVDDITKDPRYGHNSPHHGMPKGHLPVVSYLAVPVVSKSGAVIGGLFYGHNQPGMFTREHEVLVEGIAAHASMALDNARLYEEVQQLNSKKDEFIGLASHELKTPITSIKGYLQIIERNADNWERNKSFISKTHSQVDKLAGLINDLLNVSKIETGKLPFNFTKYNMVNLVQEVSELMHYSNNTHRIELSVPERELMVTADRQRIEQVIINLIGNAIRYSPNADMVKVELYEIGDRIKVSVQDFGIGIEENHLERIFSRFYRVDELAAHMSGLGIGLYISKEIIDRHGGQLSVVSDPGKGSTFSFEIPVSNN